ncbi:hypothetical protein MUCCIDRAFT_113666 [Mucor lusitanicus CBS 277.49]|uniref:Tc1-like transposase DDE domain-containing protein n=1 Tax=Mucor lusitanicus CBS 277.49 TaxID=747725 RepID=A0A168IPX2_MUCCL|nr:hypothetical protein MUCCIDRAFT_113666 [Mucor lusitanicus CBS 277.49]
MLLWGCFYPGGYGPLVALDGKVVQDKGRKFYPQEDGTSCHTGKKSRGWKEAQPEINSFNFWAAQSPDLNPIEHIWAYIEKRSIEDRRHYISNSEQLRACIHEEWKKLDLGLAGRLAANMPRRCQAVIDARGSVTRY